MANRLATWWSQRRTASTAGEEQRAITTLPWSAGDAIGPRSVVSPTQALLLVPVYAAIGLLSRTVSCTPIHTYRRISDTDRVQMPMPPLFANLDNEGKLIPWLHRLVACLATRGNAYGLITSRDGYGYPTAIAWLNPEQVTVQDFALSGPGSIWQPIWRWLGREIPAEDMLHIPWFAVPGHTLGLSPIGAAASVISTGLSAQVYADEWFSNGGIPPGTMKNSGKTLLPEEAVTVRSRLVNAIRSRQPLVYGSDWDYTPIAIAPNEAKFVETAHLTANQIAAIYDVPAERIGGQTGGHMRYSSAEQDQIHFVGFCMRNWYELLEGVFSALLPNKQYIRFNTDSLVRSDILTRHQVYQMGITMGLYNVDECRAKEDLPPLPNGKGQTYLDPAAATTPPPSQPPPGGQQDKPGSPSTPGVPGVHGAANGKPAPGRAFSNGASSSH